MIYINQSTKKLLLMDKKLHQIGRMLKTHSIKGEVKIQINVNVNFNKVKTLFVYFDDLYIPLTINKLQQIKPNIYIAKFEQINDINHMQKYVNCELYANEKDVIIEQIVSLIDFKVVNNNNNNEVIGEVIEILTTMAHEILRIKLIALEKIILVPNIDSFVKDIDEENKLIIVDLIEGFL